MQSYRLGEFGHAYPLARGIAPLLVALGSWLLVREDLTPVQIAGTATISGALLALVFARGRPHRTDLPATSFALLTGLTIASYTVVDGLGVRHAHNAAGYLALLFILQEPVILAIVLYRTPRRSRRPSIHNLSAGVCAGALSVLAYGIVLRAQTQGPLALVSALRETSVISAALIATLRFKEPFAKRRVVPSIAVALGIVLIAI